MEDNTLPDSSVSARRSVLVSASLVIAAVLLVASQPAIAQETRAESIREQQAAKQSVLAPPAWNRAEVILDRLENWGLVTGNPRGVYPWLGSVYPGGGFAAGAGVRKPFGDDGAVKSSVGIPSAASGVPRPTWRCRRSPTIVRASACWAATSMPRTSSTTASATTRTRTNGRTSATPLRAGVHGWTSRPASISRWLGASITSTSTRPRGGPDRPSRSASRRPIRRGSSSAASATSTAPRARPSTAQSPGYTGSGGLYRVQFDDYQERDHDGYSFRSLEAEVRQLIPLLRANWVLALRGVATVTDLDETGAVPYSCCRPWAAAAPCGVIRTSAFAIATGWS